MGAWQFELIILRIHLEQKVGSMDPRGYAVERKNAVSNRMSHGTPSRFRSLRALLLAFSFATVSGSRYGDLGFAFSSMTGRARAVHKTCVDLKRSVSSSAALCSSDQVHCIPYHPIVPTDASTPCFLDRPLREETQTLLRYYPLHPCVSSGIEISNPCRRLVLTISSEKAIESTYHLHFNRKLPHIQVELWDVFLQFLGPTGQSKICSHSVRCKLSSGIGRRSGVS